MMLATLDAHLAPLDSTVFLGFIAIVYPPLASKNKKHLLLFCELDFYYSVFRIGIAF